MEFVARRVGHQADFYDFLRRIVGGLRNKKDRKNEPVSHAVVESSIIRQSPWECN